MQLFVANATKYIQEVNYRLPEVKGVRTQRIPIGVQTRLGGDLTSKDVDCVLDQMAKYGWTEASAVDRTKPFIGIVYSVDKPVRLNNIKSAMSHNDVVLEARGKKNRDLAAVATNNMVDEAIRATKAAELLETTVEIDEIERSGGTDHEMLGEGRIVRNDAKQERAKKGGRRNRRN